MRKLWRPGQEGGLSIGQFVVPTSGDTEDPHDADDGGVDGDDVCLHLLQHDTHHGQDDDQHVQLVPPAAITRDTEA